MDNRNMCSLKVLGLVSHPSIMLDTNYFHILSGCCSHLNFSKIQVDIKDFLVLCFILLAWTCFQSFDSYQIKTFPRIVCPPLDTIGKDPEKCEAGRWQPTFGHKPASLSIITCIELSSVHV